MKQCPLLKSILLKPSPATAIFLDPSDYRALVKVCFCASSVSAFPWATKFVVCMCVHAATRVANSLLKAGQGEESEFLKPVWAHLDVIGRRKKGSCVLGNSSRKKPDPTQHNPARYSAKPANTGGCNG